MDHKEGLGGIRNNMYHEGSRGGVMNALQRQCMSVKRQSADDKATFKRNCDALRKAVVDLVELSDRTFPDAKQFPNRLKLPTTLKALTLFIDGLLDTWLEAWGNLGAFDEQRIESSHARMNNLIVYLKLHEERERRSWSSIRFFSEAAVLLRRE